jgi:hypothetical protein
MHEREARWYVWTVAGVFSGLAILISVNLIREHLRSFTKPNEQRKVVGILWMVPIYAIDSWLSLRFKDVAIYLDMARDCYEGYVIYLFLSLMIAYLSDGDVRGEERVVDYLEKCPPLSHPFPFRFCWKPIRLNKEFLLNCKRGTMQFVVIKPTLTLLAMILESFGMYKQGHFTPYGGYLYISFMQNICISVAFYWLVLFYVALKKPLARHNPFAKFICIKAVLFLSFWQSVVIAGLSKLEYIHEVGDWSQEVNDMSWQY